jgi:O-antigen/teichoic acid export membrane protein
MSRFRRVVHSVATGYAVLVATAIYGLASVPLALHYLSKERFALWALMTAIGGYLSLTDLGMSNSLARLLIDHKDERAKGLYGSLIQTGLLVLLVQALFIVAAAFALAWPLSDLLKITPELQREFVILLRWQSAALALTFALRIGSHLLQAHQRLDLVNYGQIAGLLANFGFLWLFFALGHGVYSLAWAAMISAAVGAAVCLIGCGWLGLFPQAGTWGRPSWQHFREMFDYGKDMFLVAVGAQLIMASQTMIITRRLGLAAAALWAVGTRAFFLLSQAVWRLSDVSGPAFSEMMVRGERDLLRQRYQAVVVLTASMSALAAVLFALCNSLFVTVWTAKKMQWSPRDDVLLGAWMIIMAILHCHNCFVLLTKKIGFMRYVYFIEGLLFVTLAMLTATGGFPMVIACSLLCSTAFSGAYGVWRISNYFALPLREVGLHWLAPMARMLVLFVPVAIAIWWLCDRITPLTVRLACHALLGGGIGVCLLLRYGLSRSFQRELLQRAPKGINPLLRRVFVGAWQ